MDRYGHVSNAMRKDCAEKMGKMIDSLQPKTDEEMRGEIPENGDE